MGIDIANRVKIIKVTEPQQKKGGCKMAASADELVEKLKNEAKVL